MCSAEVEAATPKATEEATTPLSSPTLQSAAESWIGSAGRLWVSSAGGAVAAAADVNECCGMVRDAASACVDGLAMVRISLEVCLCGCLCVCNQKLSGRVLQPKCLDGETGDERAFSGKGSHGPGALYVRVERSLG